MGEKVRIPVNTAAVALRQHAAWRSTSEENTGPKDLLTWQRRLRREEQVLDGGV